MLDHIVDSVRDRLPAVRAKAAELVRRAAAQSPALDVVGALRMPGLSVIAEVKRKSPSAGLIRADIDPVARALAYERGGAAMISVLTERDHFGGSPEDFEAVRAAVSLPLLRKDFIVDHIQVTEARALGADAVLLIVAILSDEQLVSLSEGVRSYGMTPLVEAHSLAELERALALGPEMVGINNRDLSTFETNLGTAEDLAQHLSAVPVTVGESGIWTVDDARRMARAGYDAVLVGEALVRSEDPAALLSTFRSLS